MSKKKSKQSPKPSAAMFKTTGVHAKLKVDSTKKKLYYFPAKINPEKAETLAAKTGAEILGGSSSDLKVGKAALKYDFYSIYDATVVMKYISVDVTELGVYDQCLGSMVGNEILVPRKGKNIPGKAVFVDVVSLYQTQNSVSHVLDGTTGYPAKTLEKLLKGPGKKPATPAWVTKNAITPGKYNSLEKVLKSLTTEASKVPADAKRVGEHTLTFKTLSGIYVATYYVKVTAGAESKIMRVNGVNGNVAIKV